MFKIIRALPLITFLPLSGCVYIDKRPVTEDSQLEPIPTQRSNAQLDSVKTGKILLEVADPTGTPLNIRSVRGEILCTAENGQIVEEIERDGAYNSMGPEWTLVKVNSGCSGKAWSTYLKKVLS